MFYFHFQSVQYIFVFPLIHPLRPCDGWFYVSTWLHYEVPRCLVSHEFWVCLSGCFCKRWEFEILDWEEGIALPSVGGHHAICGGPEQNKKQRKDLFSSRFPAWAGTSVFSCHWTEPGLTYSAHLVLRPLYTDWKHTTSFAGPLACIWHTKRP